MRARLNAVTESFFATLECELLDRTRFTLVPRPARPCSTTWLCGRLLRRLLPTGLWTGTS
jgi:hypothetical protein